MIRKYQNIVFDLGGVVLDLNRDKCVAELEKLGLVNAASLLDLYCQQGDFLALERGEITAAQFFDHLRAMSINKAVSDAELERAVNSFIVALPPERLRAIRRLRELGKRTYVLSNTNAIMFHSVIDRFFRQEGLAIQDYFDGIVVSFAERACKPDDKIFQNLLRRYSLCGAETLFLDDSQANCRAARKNGIDAAFVPENADFIEILGLGNV